MYRQVRPFLITSFSAASARNSQARATTNSYPRRCSKPATGAHSRSTSSASVHFSFGSPVATTASSAATRLLPDLAPLEPAPASPPRYWPAERPANGFGLGERGAQMTGNGQTVTITQTCRASRSFTCKAQPPQDHSLSPSTAALRQRSRRRRRVVTESVRTPLAPCRLDHTPLRSGTAVLKRLLTARVDAELALESRR